MVGCIMLRIKFAQYLIREVAHEQCDQMIE